MAKTQTKKQTKAKNQTKVDFPNVQPSSRMERNLPNKPTTLRVCGNTIPVTNGKAAEANPKVLRQRKKEILRKRGERDGVKYSLDETRI